ncbi:Protein LSM14 A [Orchesella cincta]|uniref:Protein LSM14 A n=1 Tax=Orchesella cincta TaxID=48709 RepID=A0A1D2MJ13_ORCCI|nr:Protein LSM14 A [Orchesella cincta]
MLSESAVGYEGILYSLDLEEATISLSKVRSFGTEDRRTPRPVGPKDEVYEFIIFRGADIKGIDVLEPPPPTGKEAEEDVVDPAIVEVQHYVSGTATSPCSSSSQVPSAQREPGPIGPIGGNDHHAMNQHGMRNSFGNSYGVMAGASNSGMIIPNPNQGAPFSLGVGFGAPAGVIANTPSQNTQASGQGQLTSYAMLLLFLFSQIIEVCLSRNCSSARTRWIRRTSTALSAATDPGSNSRRASTALPRREIPRRWIRTTAQSLRAKRSWRWRRQGGGNSPGGGGGGVPNSRGGGPPQNNYRGNPRGGYYNNYGGNRYGTPGNQRNYFRRGELKGNKKITFEGEFDFEKANEELQKALTKIKIADGEKIKRENELEDDEVEQASEDGEEEVGNKENDTKTFYQKDNFFDSISCEALERKAGKREKPDWRAERKLNAETFGLPQRDGVAVAHRPTTEVVVDITTIIITTTATTEGVLPWWRCGDAEVGSCEEVAISNVEVVEAGGEDTGVIIRIGDLLCRRLTKIKFKF